MPRHYRTTQVIVDFPRGNRNFVEINTLPWQDLEGTNIEWVRMRFSFCLAKEADFSLESACYAKGKRFDYITRDKEGIVSVVTKENFEKVYGKQTNAKPSN